MAASVQHVIATLIGFQEVVLGRVRYSLQQGSQEAVDPVDVGVDHVSSSGALLAKSFLVKLQVPLG